MQQGPFAPRALPRFPATTGPSATLSPSADFPAPAGYTAYPAPTSFSSGRGGLRQSLRASLPPCRRPFPRRSGPPRQPACVVPCSLRHRHIGSASGSSSFEARLRSVGIAARRLAHRPKDGFVDGLQVTRFPSCLPSKLRGFWLLPRWDCLPLNAPAFAGRTRRDVVATPVGARAAATWRPPSRAGTHGRGLARAVLTAKPSLHRA